MIFFATVPTTEDLVAYSALGIELSIVLGITVISSFILPFLLGYLETKSSQSRHPWFNGLMAVADRPLQWMIWIAGLLTFGTILAASVGFDDFEGHLVQFRHVVLILVTTWLLQRWRARMELYFIDYLQNHPHENLDKATVGAIGRLTAIFLLLTAGYACLELLHIPIKPILALGGAGALAAGLAAQDIVKNFFGGFMIFVTRPFAVGDWIASPDKSIEGTVKRIGWYQTEILNFEKRPIYVPNAIFPQMVVVNPSRMTNRRIRENIGIRYDDIEKLPAVLKGIRQMLEGHPDIDQKQTLMVHFTEFGAYALNINIYCFSKTRIWKRWRAVQEEVLIKAAEIIDQHGAQIAFPTTVVKMEQEIT